MVMMNATLHALSHWGLHHRFEELKKRPNFLPTDIWPAYGNVVEFYASEALPCRVDGQRWHPGGYEPAWQTVFHLPVQHGPP